MFPKLLIVVWGYQHLWGHLGKLGCWSSPGIIDYFTHCPGFVGLSQVRGAKKVQA